MIRFVFVVAFLVATFFFLGSKVTPSDARKAGRFSKTYVRTTAANVDAFVSELRDGGK